MRNIYDEMCLRGKPKMVAIGALMRKLVHWCYGVLKTRTVFNDEDLKPVLSTWLYQAGIKHKVMLTAISERSPLWANSGSSECILTTMHVKQWGAGQTGSYEREAEVHNWWWHYERCDILINGTLVTCNIPIDMLYHCFYRKNLLWRSCWAWLFALKGDGNVRKDVWKRTLFWVGYTQ